MPLSSIVNAIRNFFNGMRGHWQGGLPLSPELFLLQKIVVRCIYNLLLRKGRISYNRSKQASHQHPLIPYCRGSFYFFKWHCYRLIVKASGECVSQAKFQSKELVYRPEARYEAFDYVTFHETLSLGNTLSGGFVYGIRKNEKRLRERNCISCLL